MKKYSGHDFVVYVGSAEEIMPVYKSLRRHYMDGVVDLVPSHLGHAKFNMSKMYGLQINHGVFTVLSESVVLRLLHDGYIARWL